MRNNMSIYDPKSMKAEEFINDEEIRETLAYAEANKDNMELIEEILKKATPKKTEKGWICTGLTHREASVLLACEDEAVLQKIYAILFKEKISKSQRLSNWEADVLSDGQKQYAATDAWACLNIYNLLQELKQTGDWEIAALPPAPKEREEVTIGPISNQQS